MEFPTANTLLYPQIGTEMLEFEECVCESFGLESPNAKQMPIHLTWNVTLQKIAWNLSVIDEYCWKTQSVWL